MYLLLNQFLTATKMAQNSTRYWLSPMLTRGLFITAATSLVVLASALIVDDPPFQQDHKTWRLFIVAKSEMAACSLTRDSLRSALESKFDIDLNQSRLVLSPEPDRYCATLSLCGVKSPFTSRCPFVLDIGTDEKQNITVTVTPDEDFLHMTTLYDGTKDKDNAVDLIVVPGLSSHPYGSFKSPQAPTENWLRDYLPQTLPDIRVLVFGYNSTLVDRQGKENILSYSSGLLDAISSCRAASNAPSGSGQNKTEQRPIIFLAHSLGGLLVKQALVNAKDSDKEKHQKILKSCYGFLFFGVPNRGLRHEELKAISGTAPIGDLVSDLVVDDDSEVKPCLRLLGENFKKAFKEVKFDIVAFYETQKSPTVVNINGKWVRSGEKKLMVTEDSATMIDGHSNTEDKVPLAANHSSMVKYNTQHDPLYRTVQQRMIEMVQGAPNVIKAAFSGVNELSQEQAKRLNEFKQAVCMKRVRDSFIATACSETLEWFLDDPNFTQWRDSAAALPFWLRGPPGQGKSVLAKFLTAHLEQYSTKCSQKTAVINFFCDAQDPQFRESTTALHGLILQLVECKEDYESIPNNLWNDQDKFLNAPLDELWGLFSALMLHSHRQRVYCLIDAFDECLEGQGQDHKYHGETQRAGLLRKLVELFSHHSDRMRLLITSRPGENDIELHLGPYKHDLKARGEDLKIFIDSNLNTLTGFTGDMREAVRRKLSARAGGTYLWLSTVIRELAMLDLPTLEEVDSILNDIPKELNHMYLNLIKRLAERHSKPLTVAELEDALTFDPLTKHYDRLFDMYDHRSIIDKPLITAKLGSLLSVREVEVSPGYHDDRVFLHHQSAKDFFDRHRNISFFSSIGSEPDIYFARTCLFYLNSEEFKNETAFQQEPLCSLAAAIRTKTESVYAEPPFTFLQYASSSWYKHIKTREQAEAKEGCILIRQVLNNRNLLSMVGVICPDMGPDDALLANVAITLNIKWLADQIIHGIYDGMEFGHGQLIDMAIRSPILFEWLSVERKGRLSQILPDDFPVKLISQDPIPYMAFKIYLDNFDVKPRFIGNILQDILAKHTYKSMDLIGRDFETLLRKSKDVTVTDDHLELAVELGNTSVLKLLLERCHGKIGCLDRLIERALTLRAILTRLEGFKIIRALLERCDTGIVVTEEQFLLAARTRQFNGLKYLLEVDYYSHHHEMAKRSVDISDVIDATFFIDLKIDRSINDSPDDLHICPDLRFRPGVGGDCSPDNGVCGMNYLNSYFSEDEICIITDEYRQNCLDAVVWLGHYYTTHIRLADATPLKVLNDHAHLFNNFARQKGITFEDTKRYRDAIDRALRQSMLVLGKVSPNPSSWEGATSCHLKLWQNHRHGRTLMGKLSAKPDPRCQLTDRPSDTGPHMDNRLEPGAWTYLHYAVYFMDTQVVEEELKKGADANAGNEMGLTPLHLATLCGEFSSSDNEKSCEIITLLVDKGADVNALDKTQRTPLHYAAGRKQQDIVETLLDIGADVGIQDERGFTALHHVLHSSFPEDHDDRTVELLLDHGASIESADIVYQTALHYANPLEQAEILHLAGIRPRKLDAYDSGQPLEARSYQRNARLRHVVHVLTSRLLDNNGRPTFPGFHELGHCLGLLGKPAEALVAHEQQFAGVSACSDELDIERVAYDYVGCYYCSRDSCKEVHVCVTWLVGPLCESCWEMRHGWLQGFKYTSEHDKDFVTVSRAAVSDGDREFVIDWLQRIRRKYGIDPREDDQEPGLASDQ
ncbi:hypothetical protein F4818DRAFT_456303 [Hypoxylon cercidicola]|nr:hypothetical protein F4818DRAFT_456303 [Hypoxylon cercidicola]